MKKNSASFPAAVLATSISIQSPGSTTAGSQPPGIAAGSPTAVGQLDSTTGPGGVTAGPRSPSTAPSGWKTTGSKESSAAPGWMTVGQRDPSTEQLTTQVTQRSKSDLLFQIQAM